MTPGRGTVPLGWISRKEMMKKTGRAIDRHVDLSCVTIISLAK